MTHKRAFLETFRRWEVLFKRKDNNDVEAAKWLVAEYYKSLGHLSERGLDMLTEELKARCTFFPTIKECLEIVNPKRFEYGSSFYAAAHLGDNPELLGSPAWYRAARLESQERRGLTYKPDDEAA